jgi:glycine hydroxymethyltransferase
VVDLPYDAARYDLDYTALPGFLARERPRLVVIGGSLMLFPHDISVVRQAAGAVGATLVYDASHVAGLVAAKRFQRPLADGAQVLTFSTYKSFGGPPGGCVVTRDEALAERISTAAYPGMLANYDIGRLAPLAVTVAELAADGPGYVDRCLANASALAAALHAEGFPVAGHDRGFTASHHVAVDAAPFGGGERAAALLAEAGIYLSGIGLPHQDPSEGLRGLRIGTQEVTRRGFAPSHMAEIAALARRALIDGHDRDAIRAAVRSLRADVKEGHPLNGKRGSGSPS